MLFYINVAIEPFNNLGNLKADGSVDQKLNCSWKFRKSEIFQDFQERLIFSCRAYLPLHLFQLTRRNLGYIFLHINLNIRNNPASSLKKSGQQTAFNYTSKTETYKQMLVTQKRLDLA